MKKPLALHFNNIDNFLFSKKLFLTLFVLLFMLSPFFSTTTYAAKNTAKDKSLDQIVAIVNEDIITKSQLDQAINMVKLQMAHSQVALPAPDALHKQILEQMINKKLQLQIAKQAGIEATELDVNKAIEFIAKQNNMTVQAFNDRLVSEKMSLPTYRKELREQITLQKIQQQEVVNRVTISPDEVTSFMHSKLWQDNNTKEYHLEDILVPLPDSPTPQQMALAKTRAQTIVSKLHSGSDFNSIAQAESSGPNALQGGDLGWRKIMEIPSAFSEQIILMQPKDIAGPIQTSNGFHILRLSAVRTIDGGGASPDRKQVENMLLQRKFEENIQIWVSKLRGQAFIEIIQ